MSDLEQFREETRAWLDANCPESMRKPRTSMNDAYWGGKNAKFQSAEQEAWFKACVEKGYTVPEWPTEYGGAGLDKAHAKVLQQEMKRIKARSPLDSFGIWMLGPALLKYGNEEQKSRFLNEIARGEIRWAQGYSEPGAGSDLASVATKCEDMGDHYKINGQKIWTSYGDKADWIFVLVRTGPMDPKHLGISFILVDMDQPGVEAKPIKLISGSSPFCETFFTDAKAGKDMIVGEKNRGWDVAKYLLTHEREMISEMGEGGGDGRPMGVVAKDIIGGDEQGRLDDSLLRADIARFEIDGMAFTQTISRVKAEAKSGQGLGAASAILKYYGTELNKRRMELAMDNGGSDALDWESGGTRIANHWLRSKGNSIEGGTSEIQLNIVAKRVLGMPGVK